ncbi:protein yellow-like [Cloeon dipterum]|uniref:protein yellow-like n=1 Tax=Cloeon dipterum TaxID=197152 RepID=UPI00321F716E
MTPSIFAIFMLGLSSVATAANFTLVYEWSDEWDYEWPSEATRTQALQNVTLKPEHIEPRFMAVYGTMIFLSLWNYDGIPVTLVSLPTSSASSAPPKLTPFPSWDMHGNGDCNKIEEATGLDVDSVGRLWVLDNGSDNCYAKLWTIDLSNNDQTKIIHVFPFRKSMHDLVLDETPNETLAYIAWWRERKIVVFSLERNESWILDTPGIRVMSIALSPMEEARQLYVSNWSSNEVYSISVDALRNGTQTANPELIGNWTTSKKPYRMLMDNQGTMYAAFWWKNYTSSWNSSQPFQEQRFYQAAIPNTGLPFTFALDQNGNLWMMVFDVKTKPRHKLLKAAVGAKSYTYEASPGASGGEAQSRVLINSSVFFVFLLAIAIL